MTNAYDPAFDRLVSAGPIVDMVGDGRMEYDGPRCSAEDCDTAVDNDGEMCELCPSCRGVGGWQQYDGLIIECPCGCMTRDGAE